MSRSGSQSGFSILDMIIGLSIVSIAIVGILLAQRNYTTQAAEVEVGIGAVTLGNHIMQTIRMHRFDENPTPPWSTSYGTDAGDGTFPNVDDIDDYANGSWDLSSDGYEGYTVTTRVFCVNLSSSWLDSVGPGTNFKRIIVSVDNSVLKDPVVFSSIYAGIYPFE